MDDEQDGEITASQIRAARALLGWSQVEMANRCEVSHNTVSRLEATGKLPGRRILRDIVDAFESEGVEFVNKGPSIGVVLRRAV